MFHFILAVFLFAIPNANSAALLQDYLKQECNFDHDKALYTCLGILERFPKKHYGEYELHCVECFIPTFTSETFPSRNQIKSFNISGNHIMNVTSKAFTKFEKLEYLHLQNNKINNIEPNAFYGLKNMYQLNLGHNELTKLKPLFLNQLETYSMILSNNMIKDIGENAFQGSLNIVNLYLSKNKINNLHVDFLKHLPLLEILYLDNNNICNIPLGLFQYSQGLKILNLANNKFKTFLPGTFSGLTSLLSLNLSNNRLTQLDTTMLIPLVRLNSLDVSNNGYYFMDYGYISVHSPTLRTLSINDNTWSCKFLTNMIQYFTSKGIEVSRYTVGRYKVTNVNGIACYNGDGSINQQIDFDKFMNLVENHSKNENAC